MKENEFLKLDQCECGHPHFISSITHSREGNVLLICMKCQRPYPDPTEKIESRTEKLFEIIYKFTDRINRARINSKNWICAISSSETENFRKKIEIKERQLLRKKK